VRQPRNYGALNDTHREVDQQQNSPADARPARNYDALRDTQHQVDEKQNSPAQTPQKRPDGPVVRSWTEQGGMVAHQESARDWIEQNQEIRKKMAQNAKSGASRGGEGTQSPQSEREQDQAELREARAAINETRQREAAERARQQERGRSGPER
jgi:hypothetical protein